MVRYVRTQSNLAAAGFRLITAGYCNAQNLRSRILVARGGPLFLAQKELLMGSACYNLGHLKCRLGRAVWRNMTKISAAKGQSM
jgi:hypothetical protein